MILDIYRVSSVNLHLKINDKAKFIQRFYGENRIEVPVYSTSALDINIQDYIYYNGIKYIVNDLPEITKHGSNSFDYIISFDSEYYELGKVQFMLNDRSDFNLVGDADVFIDLIITNLDRIYGNGVWTKGTVDQSDTEYKLLHFQNENCLSVLQRLCEEFDAEFYFDRKVINFTDEVGADTGLTFLYKTGLRNLSRTTIGSKNIITRLYGFGSDRNIDSTYRSGEPRLTFDDGGGNNYLENNEDIYGTIEYTKIFEDIYPHRNGTISWVDGGNTSVFKDSGMDFDVNSYLISGLTPKVHFNTGNLAGYEFEISEYLNGTTQFTIVPIEDKTGLELPNATLKPAVNDKYTIVDMKMPASYITTAETALEAAVLAYLTPNSSPRLQYEITPDEKYFRTNTIILKVGDKITITDSNLDVNSLLRIIELTQNLIDPYKYEIKVGSHVQVPLEQRLFDEGKKTKDRLDIGGADKISFIPGAWWDWKSTMELHNVIIDPDGYIKIGLIEAGAIVAGKIGAGTIESKEIILAIDPGNGDCYIAAGKSDFTNIDSGFILGLDDSDSDKAKLYIGDATTYLNWNGSSLVIKGSITITGGSGIAQLSDAGSLAIKDDIGATDLDATVISGGKIVTGLLTATNIQTGTLTGRTVQTAAPGAQRIALSQSDNTFKMYNVNGTECVDLDDDGAYTGSPRLSMASIKGGAITLQVDGDNSINLECLPVFGGNPTHTQLSVLSEATIVTVPSILTAWGTAVGGGQTVFSCVDASIGATWNLGKIFTVVSAGDIWVLGNITLGGTVDGVDIAAHAGAGGAVHADAIAAGADGFMTGGDKTKLDSVDTNADETGANAPQAHTLASHSDVPAYTIPGDSGKRLTVFAGGLQWETP